ncbi:hypothetical protein BCR44DRAFT_1437690 [Catenaria anguillulae PL171]|uniref:Uncharacterized protein n=1 Tax=Catenaria anguillulae PL171 TaxID=765915 RepID=A0A1Y2HGW6_9FUNG|nr:hypothetical protein BCR44DRAFT_1437690 [Catenaria anguillulae PL171]
MAMLMAIKKLHHLVFRRRVVIWSDSVAACGMVNNPSSAPDATLLRWVTGCHSWFCRRSQIHIAPPAFRAPLFTRDATTAALRTTLRTELQKYPECRDAVNASAASGPEAAFALAVDWHERHRDQFPIVYGLFRDFAAFEVTSTAEVYDDILARLRATQETYTWIRLANQVHYRLGREVLVAVGACWLVARVHHDSLARTC